MDQHQNLPKPPAMVRSGKNKRGLLDDIAEHRYLEESILNQALHLTDSFTFRTVEYILGGIHCTNLVRSIRVGAEMQIEEIDVQNLRSTGP